MYFVSTINLSQPLYVRSLFTFLGILIIISLNNKSKNIRNILIIMSVILSIHSISFFHIQAQLNKYMFNYMNNEANNILFNEIRDTNKQLSTINIVSGNVFIRPINPPNTQSFISMRLFTRFLQQQLNMYPHTKNTKLNLCVYIKLIKNPKCQNDIIYLIKNYKTIDKNKKHLLVLNNIAYLYRKDIPIYAFFDSKKSIIYIPKIIFDIYPDFEIKIKMKAGENLTLNKNKTSVKLNKYFIIQSIQYSNIKTIQELVNAKI